ARAAVGAASCRPAWGGRSMAMPSAKPPAEPRLTPVEVVGKLPAEQLRQLGEEVIPGILALLERYGGAPVRPACRALHNPGRDMYMLHSVAWGKEQLLIQSSRRIFLRASRPTTVGQPWQVEVMDDDLWWWTPKV